MTVLYDYWRSSASYRMRIALGLAGIDYVSVPVDLLKGAHRAPEHLARNPQGLLPVLEIDGVKLTQSLAMLEYLMETRTLDWLPSHPAERAKARALAYAIAVDLHPVCNLGVVAYASKLSGEPDAKANWMRQFIRPALAAFDKLAQDWATPFAHGAGPGMADICLIPQLYNARRWDVDYSDLPRVCEIETSCAALPAFKAAYPTKPK